MGTKVRYIKWVREGKGKVERDVILCHFQKSKHFRIVQMIWIISAKTAYTCPTTI